MLEPFLVQQATAYREVISQQQTVAPGLIMMLTLQVSRYRCWVCTAELVFRNIIISIKHIFSSFKRTNTYTANTVMYDKYG